MKLKEKQVSFGTPVNKGFSCLFFILLFSFVFLLWVLPPRIELGSNL